MELSIRSELYEAGRTEDGRPYEAEAYTVVATLADGTRFTQGWFPGCEVVTEDTEFGVMVFYNDVRERAESKAKALLATLKLAGVNVDDGSWSETYPVYASEAFQRQEAWL